MWGLSDSVDVRGGKTEEKMQSNICLSNTDMKNYKDSEMRKTVVGQTSFSQDSIKKVDVG